MPTPCPWSPTSHRRAGPGTTEANCWPSSLLEQGVEVRSLARLHAKVLLVDGATVTVGSQNFTSYGRGFHETTAAPSADLSDSRLVATLEDRYDEAEPVDLELIERLLGDLKNPIAKAKSAIESLVAAYEDIEEGYREEQRQAAIRRFERDLVRARGSSTSAGIRRAAAASAYSAVGAPPSRFVRVGRSRITYVWRGVRWSAARTIGGRRVHERASFPDHRPHGENLVLTFGWTQGAPSGYQLRLRFDGASVLLVADGELVGHPGNGERLIEIVESANEDEHAWNDVLRDVFSPVHNPQGFRNSPNAASFFPTGWLRIDHTQFLDESVLLIQPFQ